MKKAHLYRYIHYYSFKFSKEDHVALIKLYFSFITTPDLELWIVNKMGEPKNPSSCL